MNDLIQKILKTSTFRSLKMERDISFKLESNGWKVINGVFYADLKENKHREVDIVSTQIWGKGEGKEEKIIRLYLVIECKSMKDFHILVSPQVCSHLKIAAHHHWIGFETQNIEHISSHISKFVKKEHLHIFLKMLQEIAYPNDISKIFQYCINPPNASVQASAFRETNIGSEKTLENSVLWRATQSLNSAINSFKHDCFDGDLSSIFSEHLILDSPESTSTEKILYWFDRISNEINIWHPIVVLDSCLWSINNSITPISWFRFDRINYIGNRSWWCDIVNSSYIDSFIKKLTQYYKDKFQSVGAKEITESLLKTLQQF